MGGWLQQEFEREGSSGCELELAERSKAKAAAKDRDGEELAERSRVKAAAKDQDGEELAERSRTKAGRIQERDGSNLEEIGTGGAD